VKTHLFEVFRPELEEQNVVIFEPCYMKNLILNFANEMKPRSALFNRDISPNLRNIVLASK
jgi:hypothetical protein